MKEGATEKGKGVGAGERGGEEEEWKQGALRPQKPLRPNRDGDVGGREFHI